MTAADDDDDGVFAVICATKNVQKCNNELHQQQQKQQRQPQKMRSK